MNRRTFLSLTGVASSGLVIGAHRLLGQDRSADLIAPTAAPDRTLAIPDTGWRMWPDVHAAWQDDRIYLPDEAHLASLPVNPPTGGWDALSGAVGREVTLPATVEQFYWGATGFRPYQGEYKFEATDDQVKNGAYYGVSWWWREIDVPAAMIGQRILLHVRGARQRAEVYLNRKLVGYSILEELPFECDLTAVARAGANQLAIRITNPGGRLDWVDNARITWGGVEFQKSHGFGGLDRALTVTAHGPVRIADAWVLNTPEPKTVAVHAELENASSVAQSGIVRLAVVDPATGRELAHTESPLEVPANSRAARVAKLAVPAAELWDLATPRLYALRATWTPADANAPAEQRLTEFGFRWFTVDGIGRDAVFRLNGRRVRLYTSISWGFWALNGLFPTPELAQKEVRAAKAFNLNCLNFHRNLAKPEVLQLQDRAGLLRCLEPGGGAQAITPRGEATTFTQRYMRAKIIAMIRTHRSHPSVVHYIIQNEGRVDPTNPSLLDVFALMRAADPSRSIIASDGFVMRSPDAWQAAYDTNVHRSEGPATPTGGAAGWWVDHSGLGTDVWQDGCYRSPSDYYYRSTIRDEIVEWGEMKGPASSDDHVAVLEQIRRHGGASYDRLDHEQILAAYDAFLDRWKFRAAFPSASALFRSIGRRAYESWGQLMENVRISDETDMAAISGWETTAIENHSGLVDNFRDFKSDPRAIAESLMPVRPVAKQRQLALEVGERAVFDLYLLNDTDQAIDGELRFTLTGANGTVALDVRVPAPAFQRDRLSYLVREAVTSEPLSAAGRWRARLELSGRPDVAHERELLVVDVPAPKKPRIVGLVDVPVSTAAIFAALPGVTAERFDPAKRYDVIVCGGGEVGAAAAPRTDVDGADIVRKSDAQAGLPAEALAMVRAGTPLLALPTNESAAVGVARQLANAGAFRFDGMVGTSRASWMGAWYFVRSHPLYDGLPVDEALGSYYQVKSSGSNGWRVEGNAVDVIAGYGRDHDRHLGAGTFAAKLGTTPIVLHYIPSMHRALQRRFLLNAIEWLVGDVTSST